jgi:hypothetical protein
MLTNEKMHATIKVGDRKMKAIDEVKIRVDEIYERCWYAGVREDIENYLPELCQESVEKGYPVECGAGHIYPYEAAKLLGLIERMVCTLVISYIRTGEINIKEIEK